MPTPEAAPMILTFKYRLLPSKQQHRALSAICEAQRILYNAALQERADCYGKTGKGLTYMSQCVSLTKIRADDPCEYGAVPAVLSRWTLKRLDDAFGAFFRRLKSGEKPGYPRFRGTQRWRSFGFTEWSGIHFDGKRIRFKGLPSGLLVHLHRPMPAGRICSCQFTHDAKGWSVSFQTEIAAAEKVPIARAVGIDVGLIAFAYQSDGIAIPAPNIARRAHKELRRRQRALGRCKSGSERRKKVRARVAASHQSIANTRRAWLHQQSARVVRNYDLIAVEDLNVAGMVRNSHLARSISDAAWTTFTNMLSYKAEKAGKTFVRVDPKMTSQECSGCGVIVRKGLADRVHSCPECGLVLDRDHNAALNILHRAVPGPGGHNVAGCGKRARGNLKLVARSA